MRPAVAVPGLHRAAIVGSNGLIFFSVLCECVRACEHVSVIDIYKYTEYSQPTCN